MAGGAALRGPCPQGVAALCLGRCRRGAPDRHSRARVGARPAGRVAVPGVARPVAPAARRSGPGRGDRAPAQADLGVRRPAAGRARHAHRSRGRPRGAGRRRRGVGRGAGSTCALGRGGGGGADEAPRAGRADHAPARARPLGGARSAGGPAGADRRGVSEAGPPGRCGRGIDGFFRDRCPCTGRGIRSRGGRRRERARTRREGRGRRGADVSVESAPANGHDTEGESPDDRRRGTGSGREGRGRRGVDVSVESAPANGHDAEGESPGDRRRGTGSGREGRGRRGVDVPVENAPARGHDAEGESPGDRRRGTGSGREGRGHRGVDVSVQSVPANEHDAEGESPGDRRCGPSSERACLRRLRRRGHNDAQKGPFALARDQRHGERAGAACDRAGSVAGACVRYPPGCPVRKLSAEGVRSVGPGTREPLRRTIDGSSGSRRRTREPLHRTIDGGTSARRPTLEPRHRTIDCSSGSRHRPREPRRTAIDCGTSAWRRILETRHRRIDGDTSARRCTLEARRSDGRI